MRLALWASTAIHMIYIVFLSYVFAPNTLELSVTAIIDLLAIVAPILPLLLIAAAISAQFSATVADTSGSGGLLTELTRGRISSRARYAILVTVSLCLTWTLSVFEIIGYALRAFALYYALQAFIAAKDASSKGDGAGKAIAFVALGLTGLIIAALGTSVK